MAKTETFKSDLDDAPLETGDVVTITITRQNETKEMHVSEDQFADLLDEAELLASMYLSD